MCEAYKAYFGMPVGDQDKPWAPHFTCEHCKKTLEGWYRGEKRAMRFAVPRIWREPTDHSTNCYFCMVDPSKRRTGKNATPVTYPDIPSSIAHSVHLKEEYTSVKMLLGALNQDTKAHYHRRDWPQRTEFTVGKNNVKWEPLVDPRKVLMPPLHIKLGLIKQFVRALDKESRAFNYLQDIFPKLSEAKIKAGVFVGPQIKKIIECSEFPKKLNRKFSRSGSRLPRQS
ncbi:hypothetical protein MHYP_G00092590 [Metynnis hypsauchen]